MKTIVTYESHTGFTKQYAEWIASKLGCDAFSVRDVKDFSCYDLVVHGGWVMAGSIKGAKNVLSKRKENIVFFGVGTMQDEKYADVLKKTNRLEQYPVYFMKGGYHKDKMSGFQKFMIKAVTKKDVEDTDLSSVDQINELVEYCMHLM